jgi:predicted nucleotidyltransferase
MTVEYVRQLVAKYSSIREVWLYGSRANGEERSTSDWDYLAFADGDTLLALSKDTDCNWSNIDLMVVTDDVLFEKPWIDADGKKTGTLADDFSIGGLAWKPLSATSAKYRSAKRDATDKSGFRSIVRALKAQRVYP